MDDVDIEVNNESIMDMKISEADVDKSKEEIKKEVKEEVVEKDEGKKEEEEVKVEDTVVSEADIKLKEVMAELEKEKTATNGVLGDLKTERGKVRELKAQFDQLQAQLNAPKMTAEEEKAWLESDATKGDLEQTAQGLLQEVNNAKKELANMVEEQKFASTHPDYYELKALAEDYLGSDDNFNLSVAMNHSVNKAKQYYDIGKLHKNYKGNISAPAKLEATQAAKDIAKKLKKSTERPPSTSGVSGGGNVSSDDEYTANDLIKMGPAEIAKKMAANPTIFKHLGIM